MARHSVIILPTSANELNRLMAATEVARSDGIQNIIDVMWDPYNCPAEFLPYLAWALSVDVWDEEWSEQIKRNVIAASPMVHRLKGTRYAVETALGSIGFSATIKNGGRANPLGGVVLSTLICCMMIQLIISRTVNEN